MFKRLIPRSEFGRHVLTLMTGTTIAQAIPIAIAPILTRIYTPEDFGVWALYMSMVSIIAIIATGRYELALMLPKTEEDAINLAVLAFKITLFVSILLLLLVLFFAEKIALILNVPDIKNWLYWIPVSIFLVATYQTISYLNNRRKQYKNISYSKVNQSASTAATNLATFSLFHNGLVVGAIVGQIVAFLYLVKKSLCLFSESRILISSAKQRRLAFEYIDFPQYSMPNGLMNTLSNNMPQLLLSTFFKIETVGFYSLAHRIVASPMGLLGFSVSQVFFQRASEQYNKTGNIEFLVKKTYKNLFYIGIIPFTLTMVFAQDVFAFIFGENWRETGKYTQVMIPWLFLMFMNSPITHIVGIMRQQRFYLFYEIALLIARSLALICGALFYNLAMISIALYGFVGFSFNLFLMFYLLRISKGSRK